MALTMLDIEEPGSPSSRKLTILNLGDTGFVKRLSKSVSVFFLELIFPPVSPLTTYEFSESLDPSDEYLLIALTGVLG